jgi:acetyl/propionyl-CoA carboxylase alpha subunit
MDFKVLGIPTNVPFLRRALHLDEFTEGVFDTSIIEKNHDVLTQPGKDMSHNRIGSMSIVTVFLKTLRMRLKRPNDLDPWMQRDMFRMNHQPSREITLCDVESGEEWITRVEYINENRFNAYIRDPETGILTSLVLNAEVEMNPHDYDSVNVRTAHETFKVDFFLD